MDSDRSSVSARNYCYFTILLLSFLLLLALMQILSEAPSGFQVGPEVAYAACGPVLRGRSIFLTDALPGEGWGEGLTSPPGDGSGPLPARALQRPQLSSPKKIGSPRRRVGIRNHPGGLSDRVGAVGGREL